MTSQFDVTFILKERERARERCTCCIFVVARAQWGHEGPTKLCSSDLCDALVLYKVIDCAFTGETPTQPTTRLDIHAFAATSD